MGVVILVTMATTASLCGIVCRILLIRCLRVQREELSRQCRDKFQGLIYHLNHNGATVQSGRIAGLSEAISSGIEASTSSLEQHLGQQDSTTTALIFQLRQIANNELKYLKAVTMEFLTRKREILRKYDDEL